MRPFQAVGAGVLGLLGEIGRVSQFAGGVFAAAATPKWYVSQIGSQIIRIGFYSLPVVGLAAVFIGAALALNIYTGGARFNAEAVVPQIVAIGMVRELGPVLVGLMIAARVTSSIAPRSPP